MSVSPPAGVNRLMDEAERIAREMVCEAADTWTERRTPVVGESDHVERIRQHPHSPPDAGAIAMIRRNVEDAAHLHDDLLTEVLTVLERDGSCEGHVRICEPAMVEQGRGCWHCGLVYRLRCAGVGL